MEGRDRTANPQRAVEKVAENCTARYGDSRSTTLIKPPVIAHEDLKIRNVREAPP
ncbi:hypothetical protein SCANM124S_01180 [Streptomyces canus]